MQKGKELTPKQKAFCDEYLTDLNGARAYKAVYKSISPNLNFVEEEKKVEKFSSFLLKQRTRT